MKIRLGTAPDSWGVWFADDPKQVPWRRFLDEAVTAGYEWIELGPHGYLPTDPEMLRQELESRGLKVTGSFVMASLEDPALWPAIEERVLSFGELLATLEARFLVVIDDLYNDPFTGAAVLPKHLDTPSWKRLIETTHKIAEITREKFGLKVAFHPHSDTHVEKEDQIEAFLEQTDPKLVSLCLDTGHHALPRWRSNRFLSPSP